MFSYTTLAPLILVYAIPVQHAHAFQAKFNIDSGGSQTDAQAGHDAKGCQILEDESTLLAFRNFQQFLDWQEHRNEFMHWKTLVAKEVKVKTEEGDSLQRRSLLQVSHDSVPSRNTDISASLLNISAPAVSETLEWQPSPKAKAIWEVCVWSPLLVLLFVFLMCGLRETVVVIWESLLFCLKVGYNFCVGLEHFDIAERHSTPEDAKHKNLHKRVTMEGVAWPANALWRKTWQELTQGQCWALSQVGLVDENCFNLARTVHSGFTLSANDAETYDNLALNIGWEQMTQKQTHALASIGFSKASWNNDGVTPLKIQEKRWFDLSMLEKQAAKPLITSKGVDSSNDGQLGDIWDTREGDIFHTKYLDLSKDQKEFLHTLGFAKEKWIAYDDPVPPLEFTNPALALARKQYKQVIYAFSLCFVSLWLLWLLRKVGVLEYMTASTSLCIGAGMVAAAVLTLAAYGFWNMLISIEQSVLSEIQTVFRHLKDVWRMVHRLCDIQCPANKCKQCSTCGCIGMGK